MHLVAVAHVGNDAAAALGHAVYFADLDIIVHGHQRLTKHLGGQQRALPADADDHNGNRVHALPSSMALKPQVCMHRPQPTH